MTDITIPPEAVEALRENILHNCSFEGALRAALAAWPGKYREERRSGYATNRTSPVVEVKSSCLILPLPPPPAGEQ